MDEHLAQAAPTNDVSPSLLATVAALASPHARNDAASAIARELGCQEILLFLRDDEIGVLLSAPGFPQTLPDGRKWRRFLADCDRTGGCTAELALQPGVPLPSVGFASNGVALVLLGVPSPVPNVDWLLPLLPLLGAVFEGERAAAQANLQARLAIDAAARTAALAKVLDTTRTQLERALELAREAEEELIFSNAQLQDQTMELEVANESLEQARATADDANRAKSAFLAMMSHELRTPLNAIGGYATLMLDGIPVNAAEGHERFLQRIVKAQQHLLGLIDSVLTHAKLDSGRMTYQLENVGVGDLLDSVESLCRPQMVAKQTSYDCSACDFRLVLRADRQKAAQIMLNLVSNAVKFTAAGGNITIRTGIVAPGRAVIGVRDTGIGMTADQVATVFEPFVQFDNRLTRQDKGTGLGMPISRDLARGMGGDLTVESVPGAGTEFLLTLPQSLPAG